jgi:hypothetical protein
MSHELEHLSTIQIAVRVIFACLATAVAGVTAFYVLAWIFNVK